MTPKRIIYRDQTSEKKFAASLAFNVEVPSVTKRYKGLYVNKQGRGTRR